MVGTTPGLDTVGGRIAAARRAAFIKNPSELARLVSERGYSVTRQTMGNIERGTQVPRPELMEHIAAVLGVPADQLRYGPRDGDSFRIEQIRALAPELEERQWERLIWLASDMAAETRARRAAVTELSADEAALIAAYREQSPATRRALLEVAGAVEATAQETASRSQSATTRQRRTGTEA